MDHEPGTPEDLVASILRIISKKIPAPLAWISPGLRTYGTWMLDDAMFDLGRPEP